MYIPSFSLSKYLFWITTIVDVLNAYLLYSYSPLNNYLVILITILIFVLKIPVYYVVFIHFNRQLVYFGFIGMLSSILYSCLTVFFLFISPYVIIFFAPIILYSVFQGFIIFLKCVLSFNVIVLRVFLTFDVTIPSDFGYLQMRAQIDNWANYLIT